MDQEMNEKQSPDNQQSQQQQFPPAYSTLQGFQQPGPYNPQPQGAAGPYPGAQQPGMGASYPPPGTAGYYPAPQYYAAPGQQQQQQTIVIGGAVPVVYQPRVYQSFVLHIVLAILVMHFCGLLFGLVAYILAYVARRTSLNGDTETATKLGKASLGMSITGIIVGCIIIAVIIAVEVTYTNQVVSSYNSAVYTKCYNVHGYYYTCLAK